ncbi:hypothetical protein QLQ12_17525 [Actinoplanes sp. NEAU-A12]|uniref:DUF2207 domain-containing protein n=1 Tax=Actinoplanes sandaracinus TaxID=3045177 RepID=A0ABT6WL47_9ACTN|nr:hypothetical protein [Actinoplanes sandaracinus]MDI6100411.1 hypothetical protein [Actinoplanes sandaracinus]
MSSVVALCAPGWFGVAALAVVSFTIGYLIYGTARHGNRLTKTITVVGAVGVLLAADVAVGLALRGIMPDAYRKIAGTQVVVQATADCDIDRGLPTRVRRRAARTNTSPVDTVQPTDEASCKNSTWTINGQQVVGTVEVRAGELPDPRGPFQVTAWALGDHASAESRTGRHPLWMPALVALPWWLLPAGLLVAYLAYKAIPRVRRRGRQASASARGWTYRERDAALPGAMPVAANPSSSAYDVVEGDLDGVRFTVFDFSSADELRPTAYTAELPAEFPDVHIGPYAVAGRVVVRSGPQWSDPEELLRRVADVQRFGAELVAAASAADPEQQLAELVRRTPPANLTRVPVRAYLGPFIGLTIGLLILAGAIWLIDAGWPVLGGIIAFVAGLFLLTGALKVVSRWRARHGRRRLAARHGWTFQATDPTFLQRLNLPDFADCRPSATSVLSGTEDGVPFAFFDYQRKNGSHETAWLAKLAEPVPEMELYGPASRSRVAPATTPEGKALLTPELLQRLDEAYQGRFKVTREWIHVDNPGTLSPTPRQAEETIAALARVSAILAAAAVPAAGTVDRSAGQP